MLLPSFSIDEFLFFLGKQKQEIFLEMYSVSRWRSVLLLEQIRKQKVEQREKVIGNGIVCVCVLIF